MEAARRASGKRLTYSPSEMYLRDSDSSLLRHLNLPAIEPPSVHLLRGATTAWQVSEHQIHVSVGVLVHQAVQHVSVLLALGLHVLLRLISPPLAHLDVHVPVGVRLQRRREHVAQHQTVARVAVDQRLPVGSQRLRRITSPRLPTAPVRDCSPAASSRSARRPSCCPPGDA